MGPLGDHLLRDNWDFSSELERFSTAYEPFIKEEFTLPVLV